MADITQSINPQAQRQVKIGNKVYKIMGMSYDPETCKITGIRLAVQSIGGNGQTIDRPISVLDELEGTQPGGQEIEDIRQHIKDLEKTLQGICEKKKKDKEQPPTPPNKPSTPNRPGEPSGPSGGNTGGGSGGTTAPKPSNKADKETLCDKDCPDCFAEYRDAYTKIINNITETLTGYKVGLPICPGGAPEEPGCMKAFYTDPTDKKIKNAAAVQPSTEAQIKGLGPAGKQDPTEKALLDELLKKLGLKCPDEIVPNDLNCGRGVGPTDNIDLRDLEERNPSFRGLTKNDGVIEYWPNGASKKAKAQGCDGILAAFDNNKLDENTWNLPNTPQAAQIINDGLKRYWKQIKEHCCDVTARNLIKSLENVGGKSLFDFTFEATGAWGEISNPCSMGIGGGNTVYLPVELTCCLGDQELCPDLKCCSPSDAACANKNIAALDNTISKLKLISDPSESPSCINTLKASIRNILYNSEDNVATTKSLLFKLLRIMLLSQLHHPTNSDIFHGNDNRSRSGTSDTPCKARLIEKLGGGIGWGNGPAGWQPPENHTFYMPEMYGDNDIFINEQDLRTAFENSDEGFNVCEYPITAYVDLEDIKFGDKTIARIYDDIIQDLKIRLRQDITTILRNEIDQKIPLSTPEEDRQRCKEALKLKADLEQENAKLQDRIKESEADVQKVLTELDKVKQDREAAKGSDNRGTRDETTQDAEGNTVTRKVPKDELPPDSTISPECAIAREAYIHAKGKYEFSKGSMNRALAERASTYTALLTQKSYAELCDRHLDSLAKYPDSHVFNPRLPGLPDIGISGGLLGYRTAGDIRPLIVEKKKTFLEEVKRLEKEIENLDNRLNVPNGPIYKDTLKAKEELAAAGEQVKKACGYTDDTFNPIRPDETGYVGTDDNVWDFKIQALEEEIDALKDYINNMQTTIDSNISILLDHEEIIETYCSQGTNAPDTISGCLLTCIVNKIEEVIPTIIGVKLEPFIDSIKGKGVDCEEQDLFNPTVIASEIRDKIKDVIEDCLDSPDDAPDADLNKRCNDLFDTKIQAFEETITRLTEDMALATINLRNEYAKLANRIPFESQINELIGFINSVQTNPNIRLANVLQSVNTAVPQRSNGFIPDAEWDSIRPFILIGLKRDAAKLYNIQVQLDTAKKRQKLLEQSKENCLNLGKNKSCFEVLNTILPGETQSVADIVKQAIGAGGAYSNLYNSLLDFCRDLLKPAEGGDSANTLADLENLLQEHIKDVVAQACPPLAGPPGHAPFDNPVPSVPIVDGKPVILEYKLVCDIVTKKYTKVKYKFNVYRKKMFNKNHPYNAFSEMITSILNRTILCSDPNKPQTRKSIFHNTLYVLFEDVTPQNLTPGPLEGGVRRESTPKEVGPKWLPEFTGGPYWFPPPNSDQVNEKDLENACPKWCGHSVAQMAPKTRFSVLRRLYYEMKAVYEYLSNIEDVVSNSISALETLKDGIRHCQKSGNKPFLDTDQGKESLLNPSNHKDPKDATAAFIKASLSVGDGGCAPCQKKPIDAVTGKPLNDPIVPRNQDPIQQNNIDPAAGIPKDVNGKPLTPPPKNGRPIMRQLDDT